MNFEQKKILQLGRRMKLPLFFRWAAVDLKFSFPFKKKSANCRLFPRKLKRRRNEAPVDNFHPLWCSFRDYNLTRVARYFFKKQKSTCARTVPQPMRKKFQWNFWIGRRAGESQVNVCGSLIVGHLLLALCVNFLFFFFFFQKIKIVCYLAGSAEEDAPINPVSEVNKVGKKNVVNVFVLEKSEGRTRVAPSRSTLCKGPPSPPGGTLEFLKKFRHLATHLGPELMDCACHRVRPGGFWSAKHKQEATALIYRLAIKSPRWDSRWPH